MFTCIMVLVLMSLIPYETGDPSYLEKNDTQIDKNALEILVIEYQGKKYVSTNDGGVDFYFYALDEDKKIVAASTVDLIEYEQAVINGTVLYQKNSFLGRIF